MLLKEVEKLKTYDDSTIVAENFTYKNGWMFPLQFRSYSSLENGGNIKYQRGVVIEKESLEINKKYAFSDFSVKIQAGTLVYDEINNLKFRAGRTLNTLDAEIIEKQLLQLIEKAKKKEK